MEHNKPKLKKLFPGMVFDTGYEIVLIIDPYEYSLSHNETDFVLEGFKDNKGNEVFLQHYNESYSIKYLKIQ